MSDLKNIHTKNLSYHLPIIKGGGGTKNLPRKKKKKNFVKKEKNDNKRTKFQFLSEHFLQKHWYFVL